MLRQASSRNQRSKGFKVKHALQICLLVAICIWLLYQVKHSHEKKRAFEERNLKMNQVAGNQADVFKFGRKDLPHIEESVSMNEVHDNEEENEEAQEEEEHDTKQEEIEDEEGRGAGDDEIDEQDQEKGDEEAEQGEESNEEGDKDNHDEEKDGRDEVDVFDNPEHEGGTQEAREENYKRDDASSAVAHNTHATDSDTGTGGTGNTDEEPVVDKADDDSGANGSKVDDTSSAGSTVETRGESLEKKASESGNVTNGTSNGSQRDNDSSAGSEGASVGNVSDMLPMVNGTIQTEDLSSNGTTADNNGAEVFNKDAEIEPKTDNRLVPNSTTVEDRQVEQQNHVTMAAETNTQTELQTNPMEGASEHQTEVQNNSTLAVAGAISTLNNTAGLDSAQNQNAATDNASLGEEMHVSQNVQAENSVVESTEQSDASSSGNESGDASHSVKTEEEKGARTDLPALPEIQNEVKATDNEAAE